MIPTSGRSSLGANAQPADTKTRSRDLGREVTQGSDAGDGTISPADNIARAVAAHQQKWGRASVFTTGKIIYAVPYLNWYRVACDSGGGEIIACTLGESAVAPFSVRSCSPLPPTTLVLVHLPPDLPYGIILGAIPEIVADGARVFPSSIVQGSRGGFKHEKYYKDMPSLLAENAGWIDFSQGRPLDSSSIGEWGRFDDLGGGFFMDPFMKFVRVDESCGLWMFYYDRLLRLAANNFDQITSITEEMIRNDNGEGLAVAGSTPYPWEAFGAFKSGVKVHQVHTDQDVQYKLPCGKHEPLHDDQQSFYRYEEYRGYLGQAFMRHVMVPPQDYINGETLNRFSDEAERIGVFREQIGLDGSWAVESAHSISLAKRVLIPVPKRILLPEDPTGDDLEQESDYKFAGTHGSGPDHKIQAVPEAGYELPHLLTVAALSDVMAHAFNWKGLHAFHYHKKDFNTPQESDLSPLESLQKAPNFSELTSGMWMSRPEPVEVEIDHRYPKTDYFETTAGIFITPDGGLVLRDGYGFELKTVGGNAQMSAPGDLWLQAGRSNVLYAGDDTIIRSHKSVDITSARKDVRLKAERNIDVLSGNSGTGRLLLECKAVGIDHDVVGKEGEDVDEPGIIFRTKGELLAWAREIYLRTGGGDVPEGNIVLDASQGGRKIVSSCIEFDVHADYGMAVSIPHGDEKDLVHYFGPNVVTLPTSVGVKGPMFIQQGGLFCGGNVAIIGGHVASDAGNPSVGEYRPGSDAHNQILEAMAAWSRTFENMVERMDAGYAEDIEDRWYPERRGGHDTVIENATYAPRNEQQLNAVQFKLPEVYWAQLARLAGGTVQKWVEPVIEYQGVEMMPHPGKKKWQEEKTYYTVQLKLHNAETGLDQPRPDLYEDPELDDWTKLTPDGNYPAVSST